MWKWRAHTSLSEANPFAGPECRNLVAKSMIENKNGKKIVAPDMRIYKCFACKAQIAPAGTPGWAVSRAIKRHYALSHSKNESGVQS